MKKLLIVEIPVDRLHENPWNPNRVAPAMMEKLRKNIGERGLLQALVVRPHPSADDCYEIINGAHRHRICCDLGHATIPCVIVSSSDKDAKILTITLNEMTGDPTPSLLSKLLADLHTEMPFPDLEAKLPWDQDEIEDFLSLLQLPEGLADTIEREANEDDANAPVAMTFVLSPTQLERVGAALEKGRDEIEKAPDQKAKTLVAMSDAYLAQEPKGGSTS